MNASEKRARALLAEAAEVLKDWPAGRDQELRDRIIAELGTTEASARGRSNRSRGHVTENLVVRYLQRGGRFPDAATTRSVLGRDGTKQPGDVTFAPGVVLSVKHVKTPAWPAWLREVTEEARAAGGYDPNAFSPRTPAVVHRTLGETDVGRWPCAVPLGYWDEVFAQYAHDRAISDYSNLLDSLQVDEGWVEHCRPNRPHVAVMRFETFVSAFELNR